MIVIFTDLHGSQCFHVDLSFEGIKGGQLLQLEAAT